MPSIGPALPPHLAKRSRDDDDNDDNDNNDDANHRTSSSTAGDKRPRLAGPAPPPTANSSRHAAGPSLPPTTNSQLSDSDSDAGPAPPPPNKPARVVGPALPPAPIDERPLHSAADESDDSDDDFGPAPPPLGHHRPSHYQDGGHGGMSAFDREPQYAEEAKRTQRDEWMTLPPTQDDLAARMDPTKIRARKFNSGKSAGGGGGMSSAWTETPEQKLKRLQNEALGIGAPATTSTGASELKRSKDEERKARKMREKIDASRGKSLVEQHQSKGTGKDKEDDPSKRAFDYEKDMAVSGTVNNKQRRDMLNKSKGFSDRFSSGSYL
ncbi:hypothetical protein ACN47E_000773 [Coniothyrium glycines]